MSDIPPAPAGSSASGGPIQTASLDVARSVLMAVGSPLLVKGVVTGDQWQAIAGGLVAVISAVWSWVANHPSHADALKQALGLLRRSSASNRATYDAALTAAEAAALARATPVLNRLIGQHAGILAHPVEAIADREVHALADQAVDHLKV